MPYSATTWINGQAPALNATNLNKLTDELKSQAATPGSIVPNSLQTWTNGTTPAVSDPTNLNEMERVLAAVAPLVGAASYTPTSWQNGWVPPRSAANLNRMEQQAVANRAAIDANSGDPLPAATVFVSTTGSDTNPGTQSQPYRTIVKACTATNSGVIGVAAGTYVENATLVPKNGVSLVGAGIGQTIIQGPATPLVLLSNLSTAATIGNFTLNGQNRGAGNRGIEITNCSNLTVRHVYAYNINGTLPPGGAVSCTGLTNCIVRNCEFHDCAAVVNNAFATGCLGIASNSGCSFHDILITDNYGYGVKGAQGSTMSNSEFYNLSASVNAFIAVWPGAAFELQDMTSTNVTIRNCFLNNTLSLTGNYAPLGVGQYRYIVRNNHWQVIASPGYAIEPLTSSINMYNNFIEGGVNPLQIIDAGQSGNLFHHNVIDNGVDWCRFSRYDNQPYNCETYFNTWVGRSPLAKLFHLPQGSAVTVHDNLFTATTNFGDLMGDLAAGSLNHNAFYNLTARGTNALTLGAQPLPLTGSFPAAYVPTGGAAAYGAMVSGTFTAGPQ